MFIERLIKFISLITIIFLLGYGGWLGFKFFVWNDVYEELPIINKTIQIINSKSGEVEEIVYQKQQLKGEPFVFLLLGTDEEDIDYGRSDSIILALVEPKNDKISLLSIPRDTYINNQGTGKKDKVNHAYNKGIKNTIGTLEDFLNIPIDYYAVINFDGFMEIIDEMGGLEIDVEKDLQFYDRITYSYFQLKEGKQTLSGIEALNYARYRGDADGDFGRNRRQQQVIEALIKQGASFNSLKKANKYQKILAENFKTNVSATVLPMLLNQVDFGSKQTVEHLTLDAKPGRAGRASVVLVDDEERERISNLLHQKLGFIESISKNGTENQ